MKPDNDRRAVEELRKGAAQHHGGRLDLAEEHYQRAAKLAPLNTDTWHLLAMVALQRGRAENSIEYCQRALELRPDFAQAYNLLGSALQHLRRFDDAARAFERALVAQPSNVEAAHNLGLLLQATGDRVGAERAYRQALAAQPQAAATLIQLGDLLRRQLRIEEAADYLEVAEKQAPESAAAVGNLALLRIEQMRYADARALAARACTLAPDNARWWNAAGIAARRALDPDAAVPLLRRACELSPKNAASWFELALALERTGDAAAHEAIATARQLAPEWERLRWIEHLQLPAIPDDESEAGAAVLAFEAGLIAIERDLKLDTPQQISAALDAVVGVVTFQLHYLAGDHTALQSRFGALVERVMARAAPQLCAPVDWLPLAHGGRLRVGFVSAYLHVHSVARFFASWITDLDRDRFESYVWYSGDAPDVWTAEIASASDHFMRTATSLGEQIRAARLDVLIYLDLGLDPRQHALAAMRLAPRQYATFGHPVTSGLSTLDGFLSAQLLERDDSQQQFTEPLMCLPGLGIRMRRRATQGDDGWLHQLVGKRPALLCLQNLIKLQPSFDPVLARIVRETGAMLVFFELSATQSTLFGQRLERAFIIAGVAFDEHVRFVRALAYPDFLAGIAVATLVLDSPGFSGGATSLDAISVGTPVVAFEGASTRARQTSAMLRVVEAQELIARDADDYVHLAVELCRNETRRMQLRERLKTNAERLFENKDAQKGFEQFLMESARLAAAGANSRAIAGSGQAGDRSTN